MDVIGVLDYEHHLIAQVLDAARPRVRRGSSMAAAAPAEGLTLAGFFTKFVGCHHGKEFELFIRLLQKNDSLVIAPITDFHAEHARLGRLTANLDGVWKLAAAGHAGAGDHVAGTLDDYANLLQDHMAKEHRFFLVVQPLLEQTDHLFLAETFDRHDRDMLGADGHDRYCRWAQELAAAMCRDDARSPRNRGGGVEAVAPPARFQ